MKSYTSCFVGIALPYDYQEAFEKLLLDVKIIDPNIKTVQPKTPHITLYFLNKQSQEEIDKIIQLIKPKIQSLHTISFTIGGFGYFGEPKPKVLFLNVKYPPLFTDLQKILAEHLKEYSDKNSNQTFYPHITVGRMASKKAKESFLINQKKIRLELEKIQWSFTCSEITLYGVDSSKSPQHQEKLAVLPFAIEAPGLSI